METAEIEFLIQIQFSGMRKTLDQSAPWEGMDGTFTSSNSIIWIELRDAGKGDRTPEGHHREAGQEEVHYC